MPNTLIELLNVDLDQDNTNQIYFANLSAQETFMSSKRLQQIGGCTFQSPNKVVRIPLHIDSLWNCNYIRYKNPYKIDKWFYAFITKRTYINDIVTEVEIKTDEWQTWFSELEFGQCFVEREHVSNDTIGLHTVPENVEMGPYISNNNTTSLELGEAHAVIATSYRWDKPEDDYTVATKYNGIDSGCLFYLCGDDTSVNTISRIIGEHSTAGKLDAIVGVFMVPDIMTNYSNISWDYILIEGGFNYGNYKLIPSTSSAIDMGNMEINKPYTSIDGYTPKNKKLLTFPYQYLLCDNNCGGSFKYLYEHFSSNPLQFSFKGAITPGCSIRAIPKNYKNQTESNIDGINAGKLPICSYATDVYTNWLTQNGVNIGVSLLSSGLQVVGGLGLLGTGAGASAGGSAILSGSLGIASSLGQIYQHSLLPDQVEGNLNSGDVTYASGKLNFTFYQMSIKSEYAQIIDNYFTIYGYKVNLIKVPNISYRPYWNYIKTIDCNILGDIPQEAKTEIRKMFDKGVTFWKNGNNIGNYSLNNSI